MADPSFSIFWHVSFSMPKTQRVIFVDIPRSQFLSFLVKDTWKRQCRPRVTSMNTWRAFQDFQRSTGFLLTAVLSMLKFQNIQKKGECTVSQSKTDAQSSGGKNSKAAPLCLCTNHEIISERKLEHWMLFYYQVWLNINSTQKGALNLSSVADKITSSKFKCLQN